MALVSNNAEVREKWANWIEGPIHQDVIGMVARRQIWQDFQTLIETAPDPVGDQIGPFNQWATGSYAAAQASAIRRQLDKRSDVISTARLLTEIAETPEAISREWYLSQFTHFGDADKTATENAYFASFAGVGNDHVDPERIEKEHEELRELTEGVRTWVNKRVAHWDDVDRDFADEGLTFQHLHQIVDAMFDVHHRYTLLLRQAHIVAEVMIPQWKGAFSVAWL